MENNSKNKKGEENQEPNKEEIQKTLKENILQIFNQIKKGCCRNICFNTFCSKNLICKKSNYILLIFNNNYSL